MITVPPVELRFWPEGDYWLASCPSLDLTTQGQTFDEAKFNIADALVLFFESCLRRGTLEQVLAEAGLAAGQVGMVRNFLNEYQLPAAARRASVCRA